MMNVKKNMIDVKRYHVFSYPGDSKLYLLNEAHMNIKTGNMYFEWHRIYADGRTKLKGTYERNSVWLHQTQVIDHGDFYDWMKENHPVRYKRENREASRPKPETIYIGQTTPEDLRELCNTAAQMYGHLIEFGMSITGKEFADLIRQTYSQDDPHNAIYAEAVEHMYRVVHDHRGIYMSMS